MSGPFTVLKNGDPEYYVYSRRYTQKVPFSKPLPYQTHAAKVIKRNGDDSTASSQAMEPTFGSFTFRKDYARYTNACVSKSYGKLTAAIGDRASWLVTMAQITQTYGMMYSRIQQLTVLVKALKKRNIRGALAAVGKSVAPTDVRVHKAFANTFLEFHFGWVPLCQDIYNSVAVLQEPIKGCSLKVGAKQPYLFTYKAGNYSQNKKWDGIICVRHQVEIAVDNPNLWLANQLGFLNPASAALDLVPFSFVLGWFVNLQQVLDSYTDFLGLRLVNPQSTVYDSCRVDLTWNNYPRSASFQRWSVVRGTDLFLPSLVVKPLKLPGKTRVTTALALLIQMLK